ncbi:MAG: PH domain-containing protein [Actinomycetota bacterium]
MAQPTRPGREPLVWRIPPWQPAALFLVASGCAAWNIYGHPSAIARLMTITAGVLALVAGVLAVRMYLVVDDEGIGVRRLWSERSIDWSDVADIDVIRSRTGMRLRIIRHDAEPVDVPESLLLPSRPTKTPQTVAHLGIIARQILAYARPHRETPM